MMMIWAMTAWALPPLDGCTFWRQPLIRLGAWPSASKFTGCADYQVFDSACVKTKVVGNTVVTYQGDIVRGRSPEYFIEVTPHFGESVFAHAEDAVSLQTQLSAAKEYWEATLDAAPLDEINGGASSDLHSHSEHASNFYHGRVITMPRPLISAILDPSGSVSTPWGWATISVGAANSIPTPACFTALSEFTPNVWVDKEPHPEQLLAGLYNPWLAPVCDRAEVAFAPAAVAVLMPSAAVAADAPTPDLGEVIPNEPICATPASNERVYAGLMNPSSDGANPFLNVATACAGRLGPLFPRTGWSRLTNESDNAQLIAMRIASIAKDHFQSQPGLEPDDRFQLVWPLAADMQCFIPGQVNISELSPMKYVPNGRGTDGAEMELQLGQDSSGSYVFALWRRWSKCVEPGQGAVWEGEMQASYELRKAICAAVPKGGI